VAPEVVDKVTEIANSVIKAVKEQRLDGVMTKKLIELQLQQVPEEQREEMRQQINEMVMNSFNEGA
jgi:hypothetical protein